MRGDPSNVMVVEDDEHALAGYVEFLTLAGYNAVPVANAADALATALRHPPAAVITDITLPRMSGFELAAALRADVRTRHVPVIGVTANWTPSVRARAADVRMQAVLLKPCTPSHLVAELQRAVAAADGAVAGARA